MTKAQRDKGRRGQSRAEALLTSRDWVVDPITAGVKREDIVATDPDGRTWSVEVKNCVNIMLHHRQQAQTQARERGLPWLLLSHIDGTRSWLVQRKGERPVVWHERQALEEDLL